MTQKIEHLIKNCSANFFLGDMNSLHKLEGDAGRWLAGFEKEVWSLYFYIYIYYSNYTDYY